LLCFWLSSFPHNPVIFLVLPCHPSPQAEDLLLAFAVVFLAVIPAGDLLLLSDPNQEMNPVNLTNHPTPRV
jgi:hypothetical protein